MFRKILSLMLISFLIQAICLAAPASAAGRTDKETRRAVKLKKIKERANAARLENKQVVVTRRDGTKLKGYISQISENSFDIKDERTGAASAVEYADAAEVKTKRRGLSTGSKFLIAAGIAAAVVVVVLIVKPLGKSPFPKCNADRSNAPCDAQ